MFKTTLGKEINTLDLLLYLNREDKSNFEYLVGPIQFSDITKQENIDEWNDVLLDGCIENGHLLVYNEYKLTIHENEIFIKVSVDCDDWKDAMLEVYANELKEDEDYQEYQNVKHDIGGEQY